MRPDRRQTLKLGAALTAAPWIPRRRRADRPNLLVVCTDQQHYQAAGFVDPFFQSPNLDRLASTALHVPQAFCAAPVCSPSRAAMMTGLYPHRTGVLSNLGDLGGSPLEQHTVGHHLQEAGYHTGYFGKWHLGVAAGASGGWDEEKKVGSDRSVTEQALAFLEQHAEDETPWALMVMFLDPHDVTKFKMGKRVPSDGTEPLDESWARETFEGKPAVQAHYLHQDEGRIMDGKPESEWRAYRAFYRESVRQMDAQLGDLLAGFDRLGLGESTAVLFTSDHGEMDTRHKLVLKGPFLYEHLVRIPLLVRLPERFGGRGPGRLDDHMWVNVDLAPTLLELAGAEPRATDGRSLVPFLRGEGAEPRTRVIAEFHGKKRWVCPLRMLRTERWKLNLSRGFGEELYDLEADPLELVNLAGQEGSATVQAELTAELAAWMKATDDPFDTIEPSALRTFERRQPR
jgi:arylsulfatase A-like enzyme